MLHPGACEVISRLDDAIEALLVIADQYAQSRSPSWRAVLEVELHNTIEAAVELALKQGPAK